MPQQRARWHRHRCAPFQRGDINRAADSGGTHTCISVGRDQGGKGGIICCKICNSGQPFVGVRALPFRRTREKRFQHVSDR
jgi:hypothetical protein